MANIGSLSIDESIPNGVGVGIKGLTYTYAIRVFDFFVLGGVALDPFRIE
jgi:hypothetical protein